MAKLVVKKRVLDLGMILSYALCLLMFIAPFMHGLYGEYYFLPYITAVAVLFVLFLVEQTLNKDWGYFNHPLDWAILALLLSTILSLFGAVDIRAAVLGVMKYIAYFMIFWMCFRTARREKGYHLLFLAIYCAGVGVAVIGLISYCGLIPFLDYNFRDRIMSTIGYSNTLGIYLAALFIMGWSLVLSSQHKLARSALAGGNVLLLMAMLGTLSRGTWILFPFAIVALLLLSDRGKRWFAFANGLVFLLPGLLMGRLFLAHTATPAAAIYILAGFIVGAVAQIGLDCLLSWLDQHNPMPGKKIGLFVLTAVLLFLIAIGIPFFQSLKTTLSQDSLSHLTDITIQDESVQLRLEFDHDAINIIKDHPVIGVGAEGWQALYHSYASSLYWSGKTHNYFLQTAVETGMVGFLALIAVWLVFIHLLWKTARASKNMKGSAVDASFWGCAVACFLLVLHSIIDFDMSIPAIAFLLFGLMGTIKGRAQSSCDIIALPKGRQQNLLMHWRRKAFRAVILGCLASLILASSAVLIWAAGFDFRTAQKFLNKNPSQALVYMNKAMQNDPLNAGYYAQMASILAAYAVSNNDSNVYQQALAYCAKAEQLAPYNTLVLDGIDQTYLKLGEYDEAIDCARLLIRANPWDPACYENLANIYVMYGLANLTNAQYQKAQLYWNQSLKIKEQLPLKMNVPAIGFYYTSGQARLLLGEKQEGEKDLRTMLTASGLDSKGEVTPERESQIKGYVTQSRFWLIAYSELVGDISEAQKIMAQVPTQDQPTAKIQFEQRKALLEKAWSINSKP